MRIDIIIDTRNNPTPTIPRIMGTITEDVFFMNDKINAISGWNT